MYPSKMEVPKNITPLLQYLLFLAALQALMELTNNQPSFPKSQQFQQLQLFNPGLPDTWKKREHMQSITTTPNRQLQQTLQQLLAILEITETSQKYQQFGNLKENPLEFLKQALSILRENESSVQTEANISQQQLNCVLQAFPDQRFLSSDKTPVQKDFIPEIRQDFLECVLSKANAYQRNRPSFPRDKKHFDINPLQGNGHLPTHYESKAINPKLIEPT